MSPGQNPNPCENSIEWQPSATLMTLRKRAEVMKAIRQFFNSQGVMEVETPMLSGAATVDRHIESFITHFVPAGGNRSRTSYLHTSPEFPMKRLLAAGSGDIYYLGKVFRNGEAGGRHNPEFTMLEYYRLGMDQQVLMSDITKLLANVCDFKEEKRISYGELFEKTFSLNPHTASEQSLNELVKEYIGSELGTLDRNDALDLLFSSVIEKKLGLSGQRMQGVYVYDYPASMSALARLSENEQGEIVASRFELFINGTEVANGYHELTDPLEQKQRFELDLEKRNESGATIYPYDNNLVAALQSGLPECAGVAIGVDRLIMLIQGFRNISDVLAFDFSKA